MRFHKYQATGNDFIITDDPAVGPAQAPALCDRRFGVGADGILLHRPSAVADARMIIVNADGVVAQMCGNGIRCFARYLTDIVGIVKELLVVETGNGPLECCVKLSDAGRSVTVDLGTAAVTEASSAWRVDIGNPHLVVQGETDERKARETACRLQREHNGDINVEMILSMDPAARMVELIVNERGAGFTLACGTGGAAVTAALHHAGVVRPGEEWTLRFPGGPIRYLLDGRGHLIMRGDAQFVYTGSTDAPAR